jgi:hypothetical protein
MRTGRATDQADARTIERSEQNGARTVDLRRAVSGAERFDHEWALEVRPEGDHLPPYRPIVQLSVAYSR